MVRRHFHRQMLAFRNPGLHSFAEKKIEVGKGGKSREEVGKGGKSSLEPGRIGGSVPPFPTSCPFPVLGILRSRRSFAANPRPELVPSSAWLCASASLP